jgi:hypothetical protein
VESQVREVYERLVAAFGEGRLADHFACFADEATLILHGQRWIGSLDGYRSKWDRWAKQDGFAVLSADTHVMSIQMLGDAAVLTHSIQARQRTNAGE